jgi:hypothetical protein
MLVRFDRGCPGNREIAQGGEVDLLAVNATNLPPRRDDELHDNHHHFGRRKMVRRGGPHRRSLPQEQVPLLILFLPQQIMAGDPKEGIEGGMQGI